VRLSAAIFGLKASIDWIFGERVDDAIAPGIYLQFSPVVACSSQHATGVDNGANTARLGIECIRVVRRQMI
jgi:hypothetical protein